MRKGNLLRKGLTVLVLCCIVLVLLMYGYLNFAGFAQYCNGDVYADTQVAVRMWDQKTLFPKGWSFGNQFYVVATPVLAALLYGLTGSINMAMVLATEVMTVLIILSFLWLLRSVTKDLLLKLTACLVLMAANVAPYGPYSVNSMLFFTQSSFYACYLITLFVVFGDYIRAYQSEEMRPAALAVSLALSFAMGMQSLRQTVVMVIPILACELFVMAHRAVLRQPVWRPNTLLRALSYGLANSAGVVVIKLLDPPHTSIYGQLEATPITGMVQRLEPLGTALCEITSVNYVLTGECTPKLSLVILGMVLVVAVAAVLWLIRMCREETPLELTWLVLAVGILGVLLSTVVLDITLRGIYLFMWFPLVACSVVMILKKLPELLKIGMILLLCGASLIGMRESYGIYLDMLEKGTLTDAASLCRWAEEKGYAYVYGDYWGMAPQIAVYSDGELTAGCWHAPENVFFVERVNTHQDIYGEEENEKAIYVFTTNDETIGLEAARQRGVTMEKVAQFGDCRVYTSPVQLMQKWE